MQAFLSRNRQGVTPLGIEALMAKIKRKKIVVVPIRKVSEKAGGRYVHEDGTPVSDAELRERLERRKNKRDGD